jgi:signal transduction histidine kinase
MMSAIAQLRRNRPASPDPAVLLAAVQAFPESLAIIASGLILYANPAWCAMFECPDPSQLQERAVKDLLPTHSFSIVPAVQKDGAEKNGPQKNGAQKSEAEKNNETGTSPQSFVHTRSDGTGLQLEVARAGFQLRGSEFEVVHTRDVSRQRRIERQLRESQRLEAVGRLVGGVAHDFNNLITGVMLYCDLLIGELEKDSGPHRHAQEMRMAGEHGAALVQQLLAVARPPAAESRVFALNDVVTGILDLLTRLIGENIVLATSLAADLGAVRMDPAQVQQILLNLVLNARDAMPDGGRITLTTRNGSAGLHFDPEHFDPERPSSIVSWVELSVTDTGAGMDAETLDRAFEPFFTTKKPGRGNGLGLATARRLVRQEGGTIMAESEPGKGTRVSVRLPRAQPDHSIKFESKEVIL